MEKLPGGVLSNILIRLLAKQLTQMRLVCKTWNALLSESSFIKSHLHHSIHNNNNNNNNKDDEILLFFEKAIIDYFSSTGPLTARSCGSPRLEVSNFMKLELPIDPQHEKQKPMINVVGSVNGLICFSYVSKHGYFIRIWNPSLSASLTLPRSSLSDQTHHPYFDPKTDDYKVVEVSSSFFFLEPAARETQPHPQVDVYSMRKGSWESASQRIPSHIKMFLYRDDVCVDGRIHLALCY
ncbi:putative F-box protein At1g47790 [Lactuca sativa]|uniref:putative F-box protein At1g47790 n=1 Tax=Lactuca sativa TaxID=4236 RepID=UPI001C69379A|nr:putative F-box protein At1g47790 [Lactuca sativa]